MNSPTIECQALPTANLGAVRPWRALIVTAAKRLIARIATEYRTSRGISQLMALDDHLLADVGLSRSDVLYVARHGRPPRYLGYTA